jgi:hypothetical protein
MEQMEKTLAERLDKLQALLANMPNGVSLPFAKGDPDSSTDHTQIEDSRGALLSPIESNEHLTEMFVEVMNALPVLLRIADMVVHPTAAQKKRLFLAIQSLPAAWGDYAPDDEGNFYGDNVAVWLCGNIEGDLDNEDEDEGDFGWKDSTVETVDKLGDAMVTAVLNTIVKEASKCLTH